MLGCLDYNAFAALLDGSLSSQERNDALRHITRCAECRALAADLDYQLPLDPALAATVEAESPSGPAVPRVAAGRSEENPALLVTAEAPSSGPVLPGPPAGRSEENPVLTGTAAAAGEQSFGSISVQEDVAPLVGCVIAGYRVKREIGHGGMGAVYEAIHERMGQRAAVKVMFPGFSQDPDFVRRFRAEARAASVVNHPGLVTIFNHGQLPSGMAYIMMEYLAGESLGHRMRQKRQTVVETLRLGRQVASALCAVHAHGIVHRDLKPDNIMIVPDADLPAGERAKVVDFGIAKMGTSLQTNPRPAGTSTNPQTFVGTVAYASPEQCRLSTTLDGRSDVYSLGVILYEMLSGDLPFSGSVSEVLGQHIESAPRPLQKLAAEVPPAVAALVHDMLAKSPQQRPAMAAIRDRIAALLSQSENGSTSSRFPLVVGAGVLVLLGTAVALLHLLGHL